MPLYGPRRPLSPIAPQLPRPISLEEALVEIKRRVDLSSYFYDYFKLSLDADLPGRYSALCPFHRERHPSFKVTDAADGPWQIWYCFGRCSTGGTVIEAAMRAEDITEEQAARRLNFVYRLGLSF